MRWRRLASIGVFCISIAARSDQPILADRAVAQPPESRAALPPRNPDVPPTPPDPSDGVVYICPMDPDVRSHNAGVCRRCGMNLVAGIADPAEFHVDVGVFPRAPVAGQQAALQFMIHDPWKSRPVGSFNVVHERLFHAFVVSEDLQFFEHGHPAPVAEGVFQYPIVFPKYGMYRVLADFYPAGATPQLASDTVFVPNGTPPPPIQLERDYSQKRGANLSVTFSTIPEQPVAGNRTQVRLGIDGPHPLQRYLGVWAHMLAVSADLVDMMHEHPFLADGGPQIEFETVFPRPGAYRVWIQLQSDDTVNTVHFDVPVGAAQ
jgi:heavy metal-binding protein